jgi:hypothetical protein
MARGGSVRGGLSLLARGSLSLCRLKWKAGRRDGGCNAGDRRSSDWADGMRTRVVTACGVVGMGRFVQEMRSRFVAPQRVCRFLGKGRVAAARHR